MSGIFALSGSITLAQVAERTEFFDLVCRRCSRSGRYDVEKLIDKYGGNYGIPTVAQRAVG